MNLLRELKNSLVIALILLVICCGLYPLFVYGVGQLLFPSQANGSLVYDADHKPIASTLLGQTFTATKYFTPRPSSAGTGYDPTSSSGSNLGPTSQSLHDSVKQRVADYRQIERPAGFPTGAGRCRGGFRQRPRPAYQREKRAAPTTPRGPDPWPGRR